MKVNDLGIDLGTSRVRIALEGRGIVLDEPSVIAINSKTKAIIAVGTEADQMMEREPDTITVIHPMQNGVISDYDCAEKMLYLFLRKVCRRHVFKPRAAISIPASVTEVEERSIVQATAAVGVRKTILVQSYIAAALGAECNIVSSHGFMVVDIGAGTTEIATLSLGGPAAYTSIRVGGDMMDEAIIRGVYKKYNFVISKKMAERLKMEIGSAVPCESVMEAKGRDVVSGLPGTVEISSASILEWISDVLEDIHQAVQSILEQTPPEMSADILSDGAILTGGLSKLHGLDTYLKQQTGVPFYLAENPENCVALGTCKALHTRKGKLQVSDVNLFEYDHSNWIEI